MTEEELYMLDPEVSSPEYASQFIVEAFESRFPELLGNDARYLLFNFIVNGISQLTNKQKTENTRLRDALKYIAFVGPDQCEDIRFGIENNCLSEVYKAEAERTLWEEE